MNLRTPSVASGSDVIRERWKLKAGLEKEKAAVLVVMAALSDGSKVVVSAVPGYRESTENWSEVLRHQAPGLLAVIAELRQRVEELDAQLSIRGPTAGMPGNKRFVKRHQRYKRVDRAIAVIWKMLMVAEQRFRRLKERTP